METNINNKLIEVTIIRKNIKNIYIRVKNQKIIVTASFLVSEKYIKELINKSSDSINKMLEKEKRKIEKESEFYYLGNKYNIVILNNIDKPIIEEDYIYVKDITYLSKFLYNESRRVLKERVDYWKNIVSVPKFELKIRKMTRKWGYYNKSKRLVVLNSELIKYEISAIDYVVVHELCHFTHFNHSKEFWSLVKSYIPNYKDYRKVLNDE